MSDERTRTWPAPRSDGGRQAAADECEHLHIQRLAPLYVDGRPLFRCNDCGIRYIYESDEPSHKALIRVCL